MTPAGRVLAAMAHPDDIEFLCAGTLRLLVDRGWELHCVTLTGGDVGAPSGTRDTVRDTRVGEAARAARVLGGTHSWAGLDDLEIYYSPEQMRRVTDAVRRFAPDVVLTHSPTCYMIDHEETAKLVRAACFNAGMPLFETGAPATGKPVPALYYCDALQGKDKFGASVISDFWIDVTSVFDTRQQALACHASQREWLRSHHGVDDYMLANEAFAREQGARCGVGYAEGFRQHLGHGYPQHDVLGEALAELVRRGADQPRSLRA